MLRSNITEWIMIGEISSGSSLQDFVHWILVRVSFGSVHGRVLSIMGPKFIRLDYFPVMIWSRNGGRIQYPVGNPCGESLTMVCGKLGWDGLLFERWLWRVPKAGMLTYTLTRTFGCSCEIILSSRARKPWSANRELRGWQKRGCRDRCQKRPEKGA